MKSEYTIYMDFQKAKAQADELKSLAAELRNIADRDLAECLSGISVHWKGDNAANFIGKGNLVKSRLADAAKNLEQTASTIQKIAVQTYQAEMRAYNIAKRAMFGGRGR